MINFDSGRLYPYQIRMLEQLEAMVKDTKKAKADNALKKFKRNSSFFMRKEAHPLIIKMEGVNKDSVLAMIIKCAKILDEAPCRARYGYIPVPDWMTPLAKQIIERNSILMPLPSYSPVKASQAYNRAFRPLPPRKVVIESTPSAGLGHFHKLWQDRMNKKAEAIIDQVMLRDMHAWERDPIPAPPYPPIRLERVVHLENDDLVKPPLLSPYSFPYDWHDTPPWFLQPLTPITKGVCV